MKNKVIKFLVLLVLSFIIFITAFSISYFTGSNLEKQLVHSLVDGFTIPFVLYLSIFTLGSINQDIFTSLSYAFKVLVYSTFKKDYKDSNLEKTYGEYKLNTKQKIFKDYLPLLICGGIHGLGMIIALIIYLT